MRNSEDAAEGSADLWHADSPTVNDILKSPFLLGDAPILPIDIHPKVAKLMDARAATVQSGKGIDMATAEALALRSRKRSQNLPGLFVFRDHVSRRRVRIGRRAPPQAVDIAGTHRAAGAPALRPGSASASPAVQGPGFFLYI